MPLVILYGDNSGSPIPVLIDSDGHLQVDALANALPTGAATEATLAAIKTAAQAVAPTDVVLAAVTNEALAAGAVYLESSAVPAATRWKLTNVSWSYTGTVPAQVRLVIYDGSTTYTQEEWQTPTSGRYYNHNGELWLEAGWTVRLYFLNATLNDDGYLRLNGIALAA